MQCIHRFINKGILTDNIFIFPFNISEILMLKLLVFLNLGYSVTAVLESVSGLGNKIKESSKIVLIS